MSLFQRAISIFTLVVVLLSSAAVYAKETPSQRLLRREINYMISRIKSPETIKAIEVYSRKGRQAIYRAHSGLLLNPASNLKIITTSFALHSLGSDYIFTTPFEFEGVQRADTLIGNLVVVGNGDPILSLSDLDSAARGICEDGIRVITGDLVIDESKFDSLRWGAGWMWDDEPEPYAMFIGPTSFNHDVITVNLSLDSSAQTLVVTTSPKTEFVDIENNAVPGTKDSVFVTRRMIRDINTIVVSGTYTSGFIRDTRDFSIRYPGQYFGTVLRELLTKHGIDVLGRLVVTRHYSDHSPGVQAFSLMHPIDTVLTYTNKVSDNLGAECFLREVPLATSGQTGSAENGIKLEEQFLELCGVDSSQYYIVDGSGVSHYDLVTPNAIVRVLRFDLDQPYAGLFVKSLPVAGFDGTLEKRMTQDYVRGKVHAKTGSINGVRTLSGYVILPRDTLVFSMMFQNYVADGDSMDALQDSICSVLAQYSPNSRTFSRNLRKYRIGTYGIIHHRWKQSIRRKDSPALNRKEQSGPTRKSPVPSKKR